MNSAAQTTGRQLVGAGVCAAVAGPVTVLAAPAVSTIAAGMSDRVKDRRRWFGVM